MDLSTTISLCMIAKNEADFIYNCINSALPYVDQVVVVDTGSSDRTIEIAKELGAEVYEFSWNNDFSAARNYSLEKATGDWILFMDCDEEIDRSTGKGLLTAVQLERYDAYFISIINRMPGGNNSKFNSLRLFRNRPQFRFKGKIHEQISHSIIKHSGRDKIGRIKFTLIHHGYNPEKVNIKAKIARNVKLLQAQEESIKKADGFFLYNLGIEHLRQRQFQQALEKFIESLKLTDVNVGYAFPLANKTVVCLIELQRYRDALEQLQNFQRVYPEYSDLYLLEAVCHIKCGRYSLAAKSIDTAQRVFNSNSSYPVENLIFDQKPEEIMHSIKNLQLAKHKKFKLTVCILLESEVNIIAKSICSVAEIADEIVLVTTCSNDNVLTVPYQMGADLYRLNWHEGVAKLKNFALEQASGDWVLFINEDEELRQNDIAQLVDSLNQSSSTGHLIKQVTLNNHSSRQEQAVCRIVRNKNNLCYQLTEDIELSTGQEKISTLPITIFRYASTLNENTKEAFLKRNVSLLANDFKRIGRCVSFYQAMGYEFFKVAKYKPAFIHFKHALNIINNKDRPMLWYYAVNCLLKMGKYEEALELTDIAVALYPDYTDMVYNQGLCNLRLNNLDKAKTSFNNCLTFGKANWKKYITVSGVNNILPHCGLAEVNLRQGNIESALKHYSNAAAKPEGISLAVPPLVNLIISQYGANMILQYFKDKCLQSCQHLCVAAVASSEKGCLVESIEIWQQAMNKFKQNNNLDNYQYIYSSAFQLLGNIYSEGLKNNPYCPKLKNVSNFFK